ncbi:MAG: DNA polymerase III subunit gamma/tau [SAR202 cluster bacterium]|nr:DNA polymerase III subunit gamma/tau [SAR202 cluster bacterium]
MTEVLYRKWRPRQLKEVVGQEPIIQTLRNAVSLDRVAHAFLFCGPRGTGKTSTARIMAKAVNCLKPNDGEPDDACEICQSINDEQSLDIIEIDGASNNGVDHIRDLREKVAYTPQQGKYKVYIIDEVHMLSGAAFNALLKTIEEPPGHAIFILATTEVHKVPLTILSRCQRYDFRRISAEDIQAQLHKLTSAEGYEAESECLALIARASSGSLRDAENLLEQAMVSYGSPLTEAQARDLLAMGGDERALELVGHLVNKSVTEALSLINDASADGTDLRQLQRMAINYLRGVVLIKSGVTESLEYSNEAFTRLKPMAASSSIDHLVHVMRVFSNADTRGDEGVATLPMEMAIVESSIERTPAVTVMPVTSVSKTSMKPDSPVVSESPQQSNQRIENGRARSSPSVANSSVPPQGGTTRAPVRESDPEWDSVVRELRRSKGERFNLGALLRACTSREISEGKLILKFGHKSNMERLQQEIENPHSRQVIQEAVQKVMGTSYEIAVIMADVESSRQSPAQRSHLVRKAQMMGARVVSEKEEEPGNDE